MKVNECADCGEPLVECENPDCGAVLHEKEMEPIDRRHLLKTVTARFRLQTVAEYLCPKCG